jgi:hypothetical protein
MATMWWNGPYEDVFHTVETSDGLVAIAPDCVALATIFSLVELIGNGLTEDIENAYRIGWTDACKKLHGDLRGARLEMWMHAARDRYDEYDVADATLDSFASRVRDSLRKFTLQC